MTVARYMFSIIIVLTLCEISAKNNFVDVLVHRKARVRQSHVPRKANHLEI